jgi:hypothetical protein
VHARTNRSAQSRLGRSAPSGCANGRPRDPAGIARPPVGGARVARTRLVQAYLISRTVSWPVIGTVTEVVAATVATAAAWVEGR